MKRTLIAATAAALLAVSSLTALAEEVIGTIESIDPEAWTVTLADGMTFVLPPAIDLASLQVGMNVTIEYGVDADGKVTATSVQPAA